MSLVEGSISCTRLRLISFPKDVDFDAHPFIDIDPQSGDRLSVGFERLFGIDQYQIGAGTFAFRVRIQTRRPNKGEVRALAEEFQRGDPRLSKNKAIALAEAELLPGTSPATSTVECLLADGQSLYVYSVSNAHLDAVRLLMSQVGITLDWGCGWETGEDQPASALLGSLRPWQSAHGANLIRYILAENPDGIWVDEAEGSIRLLVPDHTGVGKVALVDAIHNSIGHYWDLGAVATRAKVVIHGTPLQLLGLDYRISGAKCDIRIREPYENLEERHNFAVALFEAIDAVYARYRQDFDGATRPTNTRGYILFTDPPQGTLPGTLDGHIPVSRKAESGRSLIDQILREGRDDADSG